MESLLAFEERSGQLDHPMLANHFQNMADVRVALLELAEESESDKLAVAAPAGGSRRRWVSALCAVLILATAAAILARWLQPVPEVAAVPLSAAPGYEYSPSFARR